MARPAPRSGTGRRKMAAALKVEPREIVLEEGNGGEGDVL